MTDRKLMNRNIILSYVKRRKSNSNFYNVSCIISVVICKIMVKACMRLSLRLH